jgi:hypothetical protein
MIARLLAVSGFVVSGLVVFGLVVATFAVKPAGATDDALARLDWLSGCWSAQGGEAGSGEQWMPAAAGVMLGASRTIENGRLTFLEFMQIRTKENGTLEFCALPMGQAGGCFAQKSLSGEQVTFENLEHDFPQRVSYRRVSADEVMGHIEGVTGGQNEAVDFPLVRVACTALAGSRPKR